MKNLLFSMLITLAIISLSGCIDDGIVYNGKKRPVDEVEEIIEDKLEAQNPSLDLEVDIIEETKSTKKKR